MARTLLLGARTVIERAKAGQRESRAGALFSCAILALSTALPPWATADQRGVVENSAGTELRASPSATAASVATVPPGVPFSFEPDDEGEWAETTLDSGTSGWLPLAAVRLYVDESALPRKDRTGLSEIAEAARARGFDYASVTRRAAQGDTKALRQFFAIARAADGAAAESITSIPTIVYHLLGDAKFAAFVRAEPVANQVVVRSIVVGDGRLPPTIPYLQRHFPETAHVFFPSELVAWPSPDGRYAVRKVFADAFDLSAKIVRAELIEKTTGRALLDLSADDIGTGAQREGRILWSPDSRRFASLSIDLTEQRGNLFSTPRPPPLRKQTVVYERAGESWRRVDLALDDVPGRAADTELQDAVLGHVYVEPVRWQTPNVLALDRHEYYEKQQPLVSDGVTFQSIVGLSRWYRITATIDTAGRATTVWKVREH